jgi:hypothetical protein
MVNYLAEKSTHWLLLKVYNPVGNSNTSIMRVSLIQSESVWYSFGRVKVLSSKIQHRPQKV